MGINLNDRRGVKANWWDLLKKNVYWLDDDNIIKERFSSNEEKEFGHCMTGPTCVRRRANIVISIPVIHSDITAKPP